MPLTFEDQAHVSTIMTLLGACTAEARTEVFERIAEAFCTKCGKSVADSCGCVEDDD